MRVRTIIAAAMFSFALALVGCSDPQPKEPDGPTATPTQVAPTLPEAATEDSEEGAVVFVKHYIELLNYAANTGDVKPLREASDPNCEGCTSYADYYVSVYEQGDTIVGINWLPSKSAASKIRNGFAVTIDVDAKEPANKAVVYHLYFEVSSVSEPHVILFERRDQS